MTPHTFIGFAVGLILCGFLYLDCIGTLVVLAALLVVVFVATFAIYLGDCIIGNRWLSWSEFKQSQEGRGGPR